MAAPVHEIENTNWHRSGYAPIQECEWKQGESAVGEVRKGRTHFQEVSSLKVYRASRWSAIGLIGDPRPKTVLDDGRLSHGSVYLSAGRPAPASLADCLRNFCTGNVETR